MEKHKGSVKVNILDLLVKAGEVKSKREARYLLEQGALKILNPLDYKGIKVKTYDTDGKYLGETVIGGDCD